MQNLQLTLTSLQVAKMIGKQHKHLLRDIETYTKYLLEDTESKIGLSDFFINSAYTDSTGRKLKCYNITKKGCELIAHKMTGQKGVLFTAEYINRFHEMEQQLSAADNQKPKQPAAATFRGVPCITLGDIATISAINRCTLRYHIYKHLKENSDFMVLTHDDLGAFKAENPNRELYYVSSLLIIFKNGFEKLARLIGGLPKQLECFTKPQLLPKPNTEIIPSSKPRPLIIDCKNRELEESIAYIKKQISAMGILLDFLYQGNTQPEQDTFVKAAEQTACAMLNQTLKMRKIKYNLISKPL